MIELKGDYSNYYREIVDRFDLNDHDLIKAIIYAILLDCQENKITCSKLQDSLEAKLGLICRQNQVVEDLATGVNSLIKIVENRPNYSDYFEEIYQGSLSEFQSRLGLVWAGLLLALILGAGSVGWFLGANATLAQVVRDRQWFETVEARQIREFNRLNPHLLTCEGEGLRRVRRGGRIICQPVGSRRGWVLPD